MSRKRVNTAPRVREPVQVYLQPDDAALLARLASAVGCSKAEVMRRGVRAFAREQQLESPMLRFIADGAGADWPTGVAARHDDALADAYLGRPAGKRR